MDTKMFNWIKQLKNKNQKDVESETKKQESKLQKKSGLDSGATSSATCVNGTVRAAWANTRGKRWYNEDTVYCTFHDIKDTDPESEDDRQVGCFGCFDGHGGAAASAYVRDNLFKNLLDHNEFSKDLTKAIADAYKETDDNYLIQDEEHRNDDGCTAVTAVVLGDRLVVAHVGDSRAVLGQDDMAIPLSSDHKPNRIDEKERIQNVGGTVVHVGTWRVGGVLAVSRSFGNRTLKQFIIPHPEIRDDRLNKNTKCLIMATDGVWDVISNADAVDIVSQHDDAELAARALVTAAYDKGSMDNISSLVVLFDIKE